MKRLIFVLLLALPLFSYCQKITIQHKYYTTTFDKSKHIPFVVRYTLTSKMLSCKERISRTDNFTADPELPGATDLKEDYKEASSKYDRGHNMPAEDNRCDETGMNECFYFSNMFPQTAKLNRGIWKQLEVKERLKANENDSIVVYIGSYGMIETIGPDSVAVPEYCWKVIYANGQYEAYTFPNTTTVQGAISNFQTTISQIEHLSGYHFRRHRRSN